MTQWYYLDGHTAVACSDRKGARHFEQDNRRVGLALLDDEVRVSTVFLGFDHQTWPGGPPLLFETMVFGGPLDQEQRRYTTWDEAEAGHAEMVSRVREVCG